MTFNAGGAATEVPHYLVAEDLFAACGEQTRAMVPAVVAAVKVGQAGRMGWPCPCCPLHGGCLPRKCRCRLAQAWATRCQPACACLLTPCLQRWAGPDQAQALSLCEWLFHRVESLEPFMPAGAVPAAGGQALGSVHPAGLHAAALLFVRSRALICPPCLLQAGQERAEHVLQALAAAAEALQQGDFVQQHGAWVEAHQQQLPAAVVTFWQQAQQVGRSGGVA